MIINQLKINGFGKLENKEINLKKGINLILGKNETGKSTLLKFINAMFYDLSKNKKGNEISDYEKYIPWTAKEFSGKIIYELENKNQYYVFRDFGKKEIQIKNKEGKDISSQYSIQKNNGNQFFYEQTKVDEDMFENTIMIQQGETKLDDKKRNILIQKIINLISTGQDNISYQKSLEQINKKLVEEIGNERTIHRPYNILEEQKKQLVEKESKKEKIKDEIKKINIEKKELEEEIEKENKKLEKYHQMKNELDIIEQEKEKIKIIENVKEDQKKEYEIINNQIKNQLKEENKINKRKNKSLLFLIIFLIVIGTMFCFISCIGKNIILMVALIIVFLGTITNIYDLWKKTIYKSKIIKEKNNLKNQIEAIQKNIKKIDDEIKSKNQKIETEKQIKMETMQQEYTKGILKEDSKGLLNISYDRIILEICEKEDKITQIKMRLNQIQFEKNKYLKEIDLLGNLEEEKNRIENKNNELNSLKNSILLAKICLQDAYEKYRDNLGPRLKENISETIEKISDQKYKNIYLNEENKLLVELNNGKNISVNRLSMGTIDQMYLALRINIMEETGVERMPIFLDEVFAYYDKERLKNTILYLAEKYKNRQIILMSCSEREKNIMDQLKLNYQLIMMET